MIFYNPILDNFSVSENHLINKNCHIGEVFDNIQYDGGFTMSVLLDSENNPTKFDIGDSAFIQCQETFEILNVIVISLQTTKTKK